MIYIDPPREYPTRLRHKVWSHLVSDTSEEELHAFAARLGLKRAWFQGRPKASAAHYDVTASKYELAIKLGAIPVTSRELVTRNYDGLHQRGLRGELPPRSDER